MTEKNCFEAGEYRLTLGELFALLLDFDAERESITPGDESQCYSEITEWLLNKLTARRRDA